jgi:hypothetical protein
VLAIGRRASGSLENRTVPLSESISIALCADINIGGAPNIFMGITVKRMIYAIKTQIFLYADIEKLLKINFLCYKYILNVKSYSETILRAYKTAQPEGRP